MRSRLDRIRVLWRSVASAAVVFTLPEPRRVQVQLFTNNLLGLLLYAEKQLVSLVFLPSEGRPFFLGCWMYVFSIDQLQ